MFEDEKLRVEKYKKYDTNNKILNWYDSLTSRKAKVIIFIVIAIFTIIVLPTKETMKCNKYYRCNVERQYLWILPVYKEFRLSKNSKMITENKYDWFDFFTRSRHSHSSQYNGYIKITDKKGKKITPFKLYVAQSYSYGNLQDLLNLKEEEFNAYIKNPEQEYETKSRASGIFIILITIFAFIIFAVKKFNKLFFDRI